MQVEEEESGYCVYNETVSCLDVGRTSLVIGFLGLVLVMCSIGVRYCAEIICSNCYTGGGAGGTLHYFVLFRCAAQHLTSLLL